MITRIACAPACGRRTARPGQPDVLANDQAEAEAIEIDHRRTVAGLEVALLVEHGVVRQRNLAVIAEDLAVADQRRAVVDRVADVLRIAEIDGDAAHAVADFRKPGLDSCTQAPMQQQILGRIAAERELGEQHEVAAVLVARTRRVLDHLVRVRVDRADARVQLRETDPHPSALAIVSPRSARERTVRTPAFSSAANFSVAVPLPPEMIAPACPMRLPGGAATPAM